MVKGTAVPGSDVDLLIVLTASDRSFLDRIPGFLPSAFPCGVDVFPYTRSRRSRCCSSHSTQSAACSSVVTNVRHVASTCTSAG